MRVRRCAVLQLEPREQRVFDLSSLLAGGDGLVREQAWWALAGHLDQPLALDETAVRLLGRLPMDEWVEVDTLPGELSSALPGLLAQALAFAEDGPDDQGRRGDDAVRAGNWHAASLLAWRHTRWQGVDGVAALRQAGAEDVAQMHAHFGAPPPEAAAAGSDQTVAVALPDSPATDFDRLLARRSTCRNFDTGRALQLPLFAQLMQRVFAAQGRVQPRPDMAFIKRSSPSGGGLHPIDAWCLVPRVQGIDPGAYLYDPLGHRLLPRSVPTQALAPAALQALLAGQHWFADAPALVLLVARVERSFWKYRAHPKALRVLAMDAGHLSQTLYLSATEAGLGAFVTAGINECDIEALLGLVPEQHALLGVCGFGWRAARMQNPEFDPQREIWPQWGRHGDHDEHGEPA